MALDKTSESQKSSSCGLIIAITVVIVLAVGYTVFRTLTLPKHDINQTTQPTK